MTNTKLYAQAKLLDEADKLRHFQRAFRLPEQLIYLDGNSLGPLSHVASARAKEVTDMQWGESLIASWNQHQWIRLPELIAQQLGPILGCEAESVICCDSISVNLFKCLGAAIRLNPKQGEVLSTTNNFPTDLYTVQGLSGLLGEKMCRLSLVDADELEAYILKHASRISVLMLTHVDFRSGEFFDMKALTALAHQHDIKVIWDLAHSAGVLPLNLDDCEVDFAVGCTYKYLNGGPGAPAFIYMNKRLHDKVRQPLSGWMGHASPFEFDLDYHPASGMRQFLSGTPSVISMSVLQAALSLFDTVTMHDLWQKSKALGEFFHQCVKSVGLANDLTLVTDFNNPSRNGQLAYQHSEAYQICQALIESGVVGDFRSPNILRLGFSPLFLSFENMFEAVVRLQEVMQTKRYKLPEFAHKAEVT